MAPLLLVLLLLLLVLLLGCGPGEDLLHHICWLRSLDRSFTRVTVTWEMTLDGKSRAMYPAGPGQEAAVTVAREGRQRLCVWGTKLTARASGWTLIGIFQAATQQNNHSVSFPSKASTIFIYILGKYRSWIKLEYFDSNKDEDSVQLLTYDLRPTAVCHCVCEVMSQTDTHVAMMIHASLLCYVHDL